MVLRVCSGLLLSVAVFASLFAQSPAPASPVSKLIAQDWEYRLRTFPELATFIGDNRFNDRLSDQSPAAIQKQLAHNEDVFRRLTAIAESGLSDADRLNRTLYLKQLRLEIDSAHLKDWEMPVNQMNGAPLQYPTLPKEMPFKTIGDYENYESRLKQLPRVLSEVTDCMRMGKADRLTPPRYLLEKATEEIDAIARQAVDSSPFSVPLHSFPDSIPKADRERINDNIRGTVSSAVLPAYVQFVKFLRDEYVPAGRVEYGVWSVPNGTAIYRHAIQEMTTTDRSPEEIHQLGLTQVKDIEKQMLALAQRQGFSDLVSFNRHIAADPKLRGQSGEQILSLYARYVDGMYSKLPQYFGRLPKNHLAVIPMDAYRAPQAVPADYSIGAGDGSRPGRVNVNEFEPTKRLLLNVEAIAYHEGIPGHHLQFSVAQELTGLPPFRRFSQYNAYSEGWALYAETLAHEMGFYSDPYSEYGRLQNLMWRSIRLVVDTGVHSRHWTRQQMIDFFHQHTAMDDQNIETEVDRYIAWPGQALGYKLGEMTILDLRAEARKHLGAKFDIRKFHDAVLDGGPLPLDVLSEQVQSWISNQEKAQ